MGPPVAPPSSPQASLAIADGCYVGGVLIDPPAQLEPISTLEVEVRRRELASSSLLGLKGSEWGTGLAIASRELSAAELKQRLARAEQTERGLREELSRAREELRRQTNA